MHLNTLYIKGMNLAHIHSQHEAQHVIGDTCGLRLLDTVQLHGLVNECLSVRSLDDLSLLRLLYHYLLSTTALQVNSYQALESV